VVTAADIALWDLSLGETADVDRPLHARVPLRCRASRHDTGTKEGTMTHSHLVSRRTALKVGAGVAAMPLVHIRTVRAANQKTFIMGYDPAGPTCHLGQYAALVKGFFAEEGLRVQGVPAPGNRTAVAQGRTPRLLIKSDAGVFEADV